MIEGKVGKLALLWRGDRRARSEATAHHNRWRGAPLIRCSQHPLRRYVALPENALPGFVIAFFASLNYHLLRGNTVSPRGFGPRLCNARPVEV